MLETILWLMFPLILVFVLQYTPYVLKYMKSNYKNESGIGLVRYLFDTGTFGEALTFFELEKIPAYSNILTNVYLPTENGTTELDLVYLTTSGIYVIESKNFSGWIFGNEKSRNWTSVIYKTKHKFFNPIWQNRKHVKYLKKALGDVHTHSIIVFSQRCELKKLEVGNNIVIKRNHLRQVIKQDLSNQVYTQNEIDSFYYELKKYSNQSDEVKKTHIENLNVKE